MNDNEKSYFRYWGKAQKLDDGGYDYHLLPYHGLDVAACSKGLLIHIPGLLERILRLLDFSCSGENIIKWITFLSAIHDCGKFGEGFQGQQPELQRLLKNKFSGIPQNIRHDTIGYELLMEYLPDWMERPDLKKRGGSLLRLWISSIAGHHGRPPRNDANNALIFRNHFPESVLDDVKKFIIETGQLLIPDGCPLPQNEYSLSEQYKRVSWLVSGLTVVADWLGSNTRWFLFNKEPMSLEAYLMDIAIPKAENALFESGLKGKFTAQFKGISNVFDYIEHPTNLQTWAETISLPPGPQLFILEELTGGGKTEAALILAARLMEAGNGRGIYIGLPTMATADGMFDRLRTKERYKSLFSDGDVNLILAHSADRMKLALEEANRKDSSYGMDEKDTASRQCTSWLADNRKKALLADFGVGTIDQALLSVLSAKHQSLRLLGLSSKVLIVDEVHACDAYMSKLLENLLHFHAAMGGSAILLSATLPKVQRSAYITAFASGTESFPPDPKLNDYPLTTHFSVDKLIELPVLARKEVSRYVGIRAIHDEESAFKCIQNSAFEGRCIVWIRNTIFDAVSAWRKWRKNFSENSALLYHARFALVDRLHIGKSLEHDFGSQSNDTSRHGKVVFATQVVEQSLDVDFDDMITDLAPIDLIIQRAGRLQRHTRDVSGNRIMFEDQRGGANLAVLMPDPVPDPEPNWFSQLFPKAKKIYPDHGKLWLTARWLIKKGFFRMPEDARDMIESVYGSTAEIDVPAGLSRSVEDAYGERLGQQAIADFNSLDFDAGYDPTGVNWKDEDYAPTRLGEKTVRVRLAKVINRGLKPWAETKTGLEWSLSELTVPYRLIKGESNRWEAEIESSRDTMKDEGKYVVIIPLERIAGNLWTGFAQNMRDEEIQVFYSPEMGLHLEKEQEDEFDQ